MLNGTYRLTLRSQMGPRQGVLVLANSDHGLNGRLELLGFENEISQGHTDENNFAFTINLHTLLGDRQITVTGQTACRSVSGEFILGKTVLPFTGVRIDS